MPSKRRGPRSRADAQLTAVLLQFFCSSRRRHTRCLSDWSSDVCSSDLISELFRLGGGHVAFCEPVGIRGIVDDDGHEPSSRISLACEQGRGDGDGGNGGERQGSSLGCHGKSPFLIGDGVGVIQMRTSKTFFSRTGGAAHALPPCGEVGWPAVGAGRLTRRRY